MPVNPNVSLFGLRPRAMVLVAPRGRRPIRGLYISSENTIHSCYEKIESTVEVSSMMGLDQNNVHLGVSVLEESEYVHNLEP